MENDVVAVQSELLKMLHILVPFLDKNGLRYYVCAGTQLGAVRHKGFIPWDDDVDIMLPRYDYEKLILLCKNNMLPQGLDAKSIELDEKTALPFLKVISKEVEIDDQGQWDDNGKLWIDVFPIDGMPSEISARERFFKKVKRKQKFFLSGYNNLRQLNKVTKNKLVLPVKYVAHAFARAYGLRKIALKYISFCKQYDYEGARYVGLVMWGNGPEEAIAKDDMSPMQFDFCDMKVTGFKEYDKYLKNLFGDYMVLPPEEKRKTHGVKIKNNITEGAIK